MTEANTQRVQKHRLKKSMKGFKTVTVNLSSRSFERLQDLKRMGKGSYSFIIDDLLKPKSNNPYLRNWHNFKGTLQEFKDHLTLTPDLAICDYEGKIVTVNAIGHLQFKDSFEKIPAFERAYLWDLLYKDAQKSSKIVIKN